MPRRALTTIVFPVLSPSSCVETVVMNEEPYKLRELFGEDMAGTHEVRRDSRLSPSNVQYAPSLQKMLVMVQ